MFLLVPAHPGPGQRAIKRLLFVVVGRQVKKSSTKWALMVNVDCFKLTVKKSVN